MVSTTVALGVHPVLRGGPSGWKIPLEGQLFCHVLVCWFSVISHSDFQFLFPQTADQTSSPVLPHYTHAPIFQNLGGAYGNSREAPVPAQDDCVGVDRVLDTFCSFSVSLFSPFLPHFRLIKVGGFFGCVCFVLFEYHFSLPPSPPLGGLHCISIVITLESLPCT